MTDISRIPHHHDEFPQHLKATLQKAIKLEWLTIGYLITSIILLYLTLGSSQAMKAAWIEDLLGLIPPIVFLVSSHFIDRKPSRKFPYGFHRVATIAFVIGSVALTVMGAYLVQESIMKLLHQEHPTIGNVVLFGRPIWLGWLMILALLWTGIPAVFLGKVKLSIAPEIHDKLIHTDGEMNAADWKTAFAAIIGILGIAFGLWWADSLAALIIGLDVLRDGYKNLRDSVSDLINSTPETINQTAISPLMKDVQHTLEKMDGIKEVKIRFREEGHVFIGEGYAILTDADPQFVDFLQNVRKQIIDMDWRIFDFMLVPVDELPDLPDITPNDN